MVYWLYQELSCQFIGLTLFFEIILHKFVLHFIISVCQRIFRVSLLQIVPEFVLSCFLYRFSPAVVRIFMVYAILPSVCAMQLVNKHKLCKI